MKLHEVQLALEEGQKIRRRGWISSSTFFYKKGDYLYAHGLDGKDEMSTLHTRDYFVDDWEVVEEDIPVASTCQEIRYRCQCPYCKHGGKHIHAEGSVKCDECGESIKLKRNTFDPLLIEEKVVIDDTVPPGMIKFNGELYPFATNFDTTKPKRDYTYKRLLEWLQESIDCCKKRSIECSSIGRPKESMFYSAKVEAYHKCLSNFESYLMED